MKALYRTPLLLALSLLWLALAAAPLAAQALKIGGKMDVGFGLRDQESDDTRVWDPVGAAVIRFAAELGQFSAEAEIGITENAGFEYTRHLISWRLSPSFRLAMTGSAPELPGVSGYLGVLAGEGTGAPGNLDAFLDFRDTGLFYLDVGSEAFTFGVAASDACLPECGTAPGGAATRNRNTFLISARGTGGGLAWQAYGASSQGRYTAGEDGTGSGAGGSVSYGNGPILVALDVFAGRSNCVAGCTDPIKYSNGGLAFVAGGFGAQVVRLTTDEGAGGVRTDVTGADLRYHFTAEPGIVYGPQYSAATTDSGGASTTDRFLFFAIAAEF